MLTICFEITRSFNQLSLRRGTKTVFVEKHIKLAMSIKGNATRLAHIRISSYFVHLAKLIRIVHSHL